MSIFIDNRSIIDENRHLSTGKQRRIQKNQKSILIDDNRRLSMEHRKKTPINIFFVIKNTYKYILHPYKIYINITNHLDIL